MIVNWSRLSNFGKCQEKAWNWDHRKLEQWKPQLPLLQGSGFHEGVANYFANRDVRAAKQSTEDKMRSEMEGQLILPEELPEINQAIAWSRLAVEKFAENYEGQPVQVLWPEVQFCVPIPNSHHMCWEFHKRYCGNVPFADHARLAQQHTDNSSVCSPAPALPCWQPHFFRGKSDAVVQYLGGVWLFEHKTNSQQIEQFVTRYFLDAQVTGYIYGLWKTLGVLPEGFILNIIQKPNKRAKDQMQVGFAREIFQRSTEDLNDFEAEFRTQATLYENGFRDRELGNYFSIVRRTTSCMDYGRKCPYFDMCQRHPREPLEGEFMQREDDYVSAEYDVIYKKWREEHEPGK